MNLYTQKLLLSKSKPGQLFIAMFGAFLGLLIVMTGFQFYRTMLRMVSQNDLLGGDFIVIHKKVGLLNTISGSVPGFGAEEISDIKRIDGIDSVGVFKAGTFKATMEIDGAIAQFAGPGLRTELFFETVPDFFIDQKSDLWHWHEASASVPIVIPADYMQLYNSAFAQSQGLPVIPESLIKSLGFKIQIRGNNKSADFKGHIAGFSQRINSILVPSAFLNFANSNFGSEEVKLPSRLIVHCNDPASPKLAGELRSRGYELNEEKLKSSEMNTVLQILISVVSLVGILIVFLALLGFTQYNQLMAYRSAYEIKTLHWIGYSIKQLAKPYVRFSIYTIFITWLTSVLCIAVLQFFFNQYLLSKGINMDFPGILPSIVLGVVISLIMASFSSWTAHSQVQNLTK